MLRKTTGGSSNPPNFTMFRRAGEGRGKKKCSLFLKEGYAGGCTSFRRLGGSVAKKEKAALQKEVALQNLHYSPLNPLKGCNPQRQGL